MISFQNSPNFKKIHLLIVVNFSANNFPIDFYQFNLPSHPCSILFSISSLSRCTKVRHRFIQCLQIHKANHAENLIMFAKRQKTKKEAKVKISDFQQTLFEERLITFRSFFSFVASHHNHLLPSFFISPAHILAHNS